jgi:hypothetical protein
LGILSELVDLSVPAFDLSPVPLVFLLVEDFPPPLLPLLLLLFPAPAEFPLLVGGVLAPFGKKFSKPISQI